MFALAASRFTVQVARGEAEKSKLKELEEDPASNWKVDVTFSTSELGTNFRKIIEDIFTGLAADCADEEERVRADKIPRNPRQRALLEELTICEKLLKKK